MCGRRDESLLVDDLLHAVLRLLKLGADASHGSLATDEDKGDAILFNLVILGEAAKRVSPGLRMRFPDIPWTDMAETRDRVVHHYEGIDWRVITEIIEEDLPALADRLQQVHIGLEPGA